MRRLCLRSGVLLAAPLLLVLGAWLVGSGKVGATSSLQYIERTTGGAASAAPLPLLVVMHGLGDAPEHFLPLFNELAVPARVVAVRAPDPWGAGFSWYAIDADPALKARQIMARADAVAELLGELTKRRPTLGRPVVSGFSQGGVLSFALASYHADKLQGAVPIAGSLPPGMPAPRKPPPWFSVLAFHGREDRRIPARDGERTLQRLKDAGYAGSITTFPGLGHGVNDAMHAQLMAALSELLASATESP